MYNVAQTLILHVLTIKLSPLHLLDHGICDTLRNKIIKEVWKEYK